MAYELRGLGSLVPTGAPLPFDPLDQPVTLRQLQAIEADERRTFQYTVAIGAAVILAGMYFIEEYWGRH